MPMITVTIPEGLIPGAADTGLVRDLTHAVLRAEGVAQPGPFHLNNTAAFIHRLPVASLGTAAQQPAKIARIDIITPPGSLKREGQRQVTKEATEIVAKAAGDARLAASTWVILSEAAEGGWGIAGTAYGIPEFTELAKRAAAAQAAKAE